MLVPTLSATQLMHAAASLSGYLALQSALIALAPCANVVPQSPSPTLQAPRETHWGDLHPHSIALAKCIADMPQSQCSPGLLK